MNTKFTPGPWKLISGISDWGMPRTHVVLPAGCHEDDYESWIAEVASVTPYCIGASPKERRRAVRQDANARLIAAAPELLEALQVAFTYMDPASCPEAEDVETVRAAIAAATGENS